MLSLVAHNSIPLDTFIDVAHAIGPDWFPGTFSPNAGTYICCPSLNGTAKLMEFKSALFVLPPAALIASITREPGRTM